MKRNYMNKNAELRAYEESWVLARQIETDNKIVEATHTLQQVSNKTLSSKLSSSKEEIKDPLEIRAPKLLTAEEE